MILALTLAITNSGLYGPRAAPAGFGFWKTGTQYWVFNTQRAISPTGA